VLQGLLRTSCFAVYVSHWNSINRPLDYHRVQLPPSNSPFFTEWPLNHAQPAPIGSSRPLVTNAVRPQLVSSVMKQERPVARDAQDGVWSGQKKSS